ncbi:uncharacterized protein LOC122577083 [Bombus pyrosoma]|uniref:uncharacterized protein LOC122577083 n=1 Tax=Bombus pyrosoma TaxID=396416 RepID=UPI001CB8D830|nr:uncharacterized protein LOC122577083 [Bombus pyrosoma]
MTQILTGHGVFGEYLKKIGRETTDTCHHCGEDRDTTQHTLETCPAWELPRYTLRQVIDERLTPSAIIAAMLSGPQEYEAVRLFCERVMLAKERAERTSRLFMSPLTSRRPDDRPLPSSAEDPSQSCDDRQCEPGEAPHAEPTRLGGSETP